MLDKYNFKYLILYKNNDKMYIQNSFYYKMSKCKIQLQPIQQLIFNRIR